MFEIIFDPYNYPFWIFILLILAVAIAVISRPYSTYVKFAYVNAKFEAIGNPFIEEKEISRLIDSKDIFEFKDTLNSFKDYNIKGESPDEIQKSIDDVFIQTLNQSKKDSSKYMNDFFNIYLDKIDFYVIKNVIKNKLINENIEENIINKCILSKNKNLVEELSSIEQDKIPEILKKYGFNEDISSTISNGKNDFLMFDTQIDKFIINKFKNVKVPKNCEQGKQKYIFRMIDIINIKNLLRSKQFLFDEKKCMKLFIGDGQEIAKWKYKEIAQTEQVTQVISGLEGTSYFDILKDSIEEYNKDGSIQVFENSLDRIFIKHIKDISIKNYVNIGPTIRFLVSKEFEIMNLKIIVKGIFEKIQSNIIKKLIVMEAS